ncbi:MAG: cell division ATPase MinD [Candidatus Micrarchaeota archaeon]
MKSIAFASGKGGVGKSTIALNLGLVLALAGKRVVVVDADLQMANIGVMLGVERTPITLNNVLAGENQVKDAVYEGPHGLKYVPSGLNLTKLSEIDYPKLKEAIEALEEQNDFVLIDCPPGLGPDAMAAMQSTKELVLILTPDPASLADALKTKTIAEREGVKITGVIVNMVLGDKTEIRRDDLESIMEIPVLVSLPEDKEVRRSTAAQVPVVTQAPDSRFTKGIIDLASRITGQRIKQALPRKGFFQKMKDFFANLFHKKKPALPA